MKLNKFIAAAVAILVVGLAWTHRDQVQARFSCADMIAHQQVSTKVVPGAWDCIPYDTQQAFAIFVGVYNPKQFADYISASNASYNYLGETNDGGYTYRLDQAFNPHNSIIGAAMVVWHTPWIWKQSPTQFQHMIENIWMELNGETQGWTSKVETLYLYPPGSSLVMGGHTYDISGKLNVIQ